MILVLPMDIMSTANPDAELLAKIDAFIARTGMAPTRFGRETMADGWLIEHLRNGRSLSLKNARKVIRFMEEYEKPMHCGTCGTRAQGEVAACTVADCALRAKEALAA